MNVRLLHPDREAVRSTSGPHDLDLVQDLGLGPIIDAMAGDDPAIQTAVREALLSPLQDPAAVAYRQAVLADCLAHPTVIRDVYAWSGIALERKRRAYVGFYGNRPSSLLSRSVEALRPLIPDFTRIREAVVDERLAWRSTGWLGLTASLRAQLDEAYLGELGTLLDELEWPRGVRMGAGLDANLRSTEMVLHQPPARSPWVRRMTVRRSHTLSFTIPERDDSGFQALSDLRDEGIKIAARLTAAALDQMLQFLQTLRDELAFYVGCLNFVERMTALGSPLCVPTVLDAGDGHRQAEGLYDAALALTQNHPVVGNTVHGERSRLLVITGANQGGKTTFVRSLGQAQLMMQAGMLVAAQRFAGPLRTGVFTHFKRGEDDAMTRGKLDEELHRMSELVKALRHGSLLLFNESFQSTHEREGAAIAREVVDGLLAAGVEVVFVTHLSELSRAWFAEHRPDYEFLRAERRPDGSRSYRMVPGEPETTSYGADVYREVFGDRLPGLRGEPTGQELP